MRKKHLPSEGASFTLNTNYTAEDIASVISALNSELTDINVVVNPKMHRFIYIYSGTGTTPDVVFQDVVNNIGDLTTYTVFEGVHVKYGAHFVTGMLYAEKDFGVMLQINFTGTAYIVFLNNGTYTYKSITLT